MKIDNAFLTSSGHVGMEIKDGKNTIFVYENSRGVHVSEEFKPYVQKKAVAFFKQKYRQFKGM